MARSRRAGAFCDIDNICHVVAMPMRNENEVRRDFFTSISFASGFGVMKGSNKRFLPPDFDREAGVSVIGEFHEFEIESVSS